jgi:hypothetical protein
MEASGQLHVPAASGKTAPGNHYTGVWVGQKVNISDKITVRNPFD